MIEDNHRAHTCAIEQTLNAQAAERKPTVSFDDVWDRYTGKTEAGLRTLSRIKVRTLCIAAAILLLAAPIGFTPSVRAALNEFIVVKLIKNNRDHASIFHHWDVQRKWDEAQSYATLEDAAKSTGTPFPVPGKLVEYEKSALNKQYNVTTDHGQIAGYYFSIRTHERMLDVTAKYEEPAVPSFSAESRAQAMVKETTVEGQPAKLFAVQEFPGYTLYFERDGWKFVISGYASGVGNVQPTPFTEEEIRQIAESIR
ncbi:hypothetical protein ACFQI7_17495 [Paenibacillus allorhizosphaerae]|uniref:DUF4367 domain-containing protein n=1 Tax=Paenibacillus allorhizosphaerae TaxID=2849866 RepID=A0ABM8VF81_9BACL|nr:hypothetical protein [Paenibacillus allorhizosphaerae]CAG7631775.1 hypothetical protein PAECIP111802_01778 [Paenibacillus allorhizosphaerae]